MVDDDGTAGVSSGRRALHHRRRGRPQRLSDARLEGRLAAAADDLRLCIHVSHFPPGTSKWNKVEHRLFCHITENWRGRSLRTFETIVELIGHTRTTTGLRVRAKLDKRRHKTGLTTAEMRALALHPHAFHGDWNYELRPRPT